MALPRSEEICSDYIDLVSLLCLSILWCQGHSIEKAKSLFLLINPPDTYKVQDGVAANDKEWDSTLKILFYIATGFVWDLTK